MITTWLINRQRPLLIIEDSELIEIFQYLNPTVTLIKADTIKNSMMELYDMGKKELKVVVYCYYIAFSFQQLLTVY
jgi:hypothetical protein